MKTSAPTLMVSIASPVVYIKVCGRATSESGQNFKSLIGRLYDRGLRQFVLDLSDCLMMDSTFLGVLARTGLKLQEESRSGTGAPIQLLNTNQRVLDLLENLGVVQLFELVRGANLDPGQCEVHQEESSSREEICRTSLEAHQTLMEINPDNIPKFKEVARFLEEDLARNRQGEGANEAESGERPG